MKKIYVLLILLLFCLCGCINSTQNNTISVDTPQDNSINGIDFSKVIKIDAPGCLPISTKSIKEILDDTGRFTYNRITFPGSAAADLYFRLDKPDNEDSETARISYQVLPENTTNIISYNFAKSAVNGDKHDAIKWGLDILLHIFGVELTNEVWADIMEIAAISENDEAWGTDHEGHIDETNGIRLIYGNLGGNIQIDIRTR